MKLRQFAFVPLLALGHFVAVPEIAFAQDKEEARPRAEKSPGGFPRRDSASKGAPSAAHMAPPPGMHLQPAPKTGSMPGRHAAAPKGRLGTEPSRKEKLGTPPPQGSKDKPPRPQ